MFLFPIAVKHVSEGLVREHHTCKLFVNIVNTQWTIIWYLFLFNHLLLAAAAKSLQLCLTLCDPIDGSPPGSSIHGVFQERVLEWGAITFSAFTPYLFSIKTISGRFQGTSNMNSERKEIRCLKKKSSVIKNELNCGMRSTLKSCSPSCQH